VNAVNERVNEFVSGAVRKPFDKQLVDVTLCNLKSYVSRVLTCAQLVHLFVWVSIALTLRFGARAT